MNLCQLLDALLKNPTSNGHRGFNSDEVSLGKLRAVENDGFIDITDPHHESENGDDKEIAMTRITEQGLKYHRLHCKPSQ